MIWTMYRQWCKGVTRVACIHHVHYMAYIYSDHLITNISVRKPSSISLHYLLVVLCFYGHCQKCFLCLFCDTVRGKTRHSPWTHGGNVPQSAPASVNAQVFPQTRNALERSCTHDALFLILYLWSHHVSHCVVRCIRTVSKEYKLIKWSNWEKQQEVLRWRTNQDEIPCLPPPVARTGKQLCKQFL